MNLFPGDPALSELRNKVIHSQKVENAKSRKMMKERIDFSNMNDSRSCEQGERPQVFDRSDFGHLLDDRLRTQQAENIESVNQLVRTLIDWRSKTEKPINAGEITEDLDDWRESPIWKRPWTRERLEDDKTALHLSLPFSILAVLENMIRSNKDDYHVLSTLR